jgi:16S rRNA U516 pseudouridylate synthase RsuA-like enzyme
MTTPPTDIAASPFNQGEGHHPTKGKKGFQPKEVKTDVQMSFKVTQAQAQAIRKECKERGVTLSQLVRAGIACYVLPPAEEGYVNVDRDQLAFWD